MVETKKHRKRKKGNNLQEKKSLFSELNFGNAFSWTALASGEIENNGTFSLLSAAHCSVRSLLSFTSKNTFVFVSCSFNLPIYLDLILASKSEWEVLFLPLWPILTHRGSVRFSTSIEHFVKAISPAGLGLFIMSNWSSGAPTSWDEWGQSEGGEGQGNGNHRGRGGGGWRGSNQAQHDSYAGQRGQNRGRGGAARRQRGNYGRRGEGHHSSTYYNSNETYESSSYNSNDASYNSSSYGGSTGGPSNRSSPYNAQPSSSSATSTSGQYGLTMPPPSSVPNVSKDYSWEPLRVSKMLE